MRMVKIQNTDSPRCCKDVDQQELSFIAGENAKWDSRFGRQFGNFLQNQSLSSYDPAIFLLGIYTRNLKFYDTEKHACGCG